MKSLLLFAFLFTTSLIAIEINELEDEKSELEIENWSSANNLTNLKTHPQDQSEAELNLYKIIDTIDIKTDSTKGLYASNVRSRFPNSKENVYLDKPKIKFLKDRIVAIKDSYGINQFSLLLNHHLTLNSKLFLSQNRDRFDYDIKFKLKHDEYVRRSRNNQVIIIPNSGATFFDVNVTLGYQEKQWGLSSKIGYAHLDEQLQFLWSTNNATQARNLFLNLYFNYTWKQNRFKVESLNEWNDNSIDPNLLKYSHFSTFQSLDYEFFASENNLWRAKANYEYRMVRGDNPVKAHYFNVLVLRKLELFKLLILDIGIGVDGNIIDLNKMDNPVFVYPLFKIKGQLIKNRLSWFVGAEGLSYKKNAQVDLIDKRYLEPTLPLKPDRNIIINGNLHLALPVLTLSLEPEFIYHHHDYIISVTTNQLLGYVSATGWEGRLNLKYILHINKIVKWQGGYIYGFLNAGNFSFPEHTLENNLKFRLEFIGSDIGFNTTFLLNRLILNDRKNALSLPHYQRLELFFSKDLGKTGRIEFRINNLLDSNLTFLPNFSESGRNFELGTTIQF